MLLLAVPPPVFADELSGELPKSVRDILDEGGTDLSDAARWHFSDLCDTVGAWAAEGLQPALHLAAQSAGYLLLAGLLGLLAGDPYRAYVEILAVLGFGTLSLSAAMQLTELVAATAQDCRTYLTAFVPVFSGLAAAGGQTSGALVYSGMFFAMSGFLSAIIQKLLLPVMQLYFCFAVSACLWDNPGMGDAAALFSRCLHWLLKGCGALFSLVLGLQSVLAATADSAALRTGKGGIAGCHSRCRGRRSRSADGRCRRRTAAEGFSGLGGAAGTGRAVCPGTAPMPCLRAGLCRRGHLGRGHRAKAVRTALPPLL